MKLRSIKRGVGTGFANLIRNYNLSLASIGTISICLLVLGITFVLLFNVTSFTNQMDDNLCVVVFLNQGLDDEAKAAMQKQIEARPEAASVTYVSGEEAWEDFKQELGEDDTLDSDLTEYVEGNPLADSDNFQIILSSADGQASLVEYLQNLEGVRKVNYSSAISEVLSSLIRVVSIIGIAMIAILLVVSVLLISNTVRTSVMIRKEEIAIQKYLGASDAFVELPFLIEGLAIGILGTVVPILVVYFGYGRLLEAAETYFGTLTELIDFVPLSQIVYYLFPTYFLISLVVGTIGSLLTMKKYLRA